LEAENEPSKHDNKEGTNMAIERREKATVVCEVCFWLVVMEFEIIDKEIRRVAHLW